MLFATSLMKLITNSYHLLFQNTKEYFSRSAILMILMIFWWLVHLLKNFFGCNLQFCPPVLDQCFPYRDSGLLHRSLKMHEKQLQRSVVLNEYVCHIFVTLLKLALLHRCLLSTLEVQINNPISL